MRLRILFLVLLLPALACKHKKPIVDGPVPEERISCDIPPPGYIPDTLKSLNKYVELLSYRKLGYEHFCYTVISNVHLVDTEHGTVTPGLHTVVLHEHQIDTIMEAGAKVPHFERELCVLKVNGNGRYLAPGLCDMHVHYNCGARDRLQFLLHGTTTIRNVHGNPVHAQEQQFLAEGPLVGPNLYTTAPCFAYRGAITDYAQFPTVKTTCVTSTDPDSALLARQGILAASWLFNEFSSDSSSTARLADFARAHQLSLSVDIVGDFPKIAYPDKTVFEKQAGFAYLQSLPNFSTFWFVQNVRPYLVQKGQKPKLLASDSIFLAAIRADNSHFCIGTEQSNGDKFLSVAEEMDKLVDLGIPAATALRMATFNAGELVKNTTSCVWGTGSFAPSYTYLDLSFGSIKPWQRADLVLLDQDPFVDVMTYYRPSSVFLNGVYFSPTDLSEMRRALEKL